MIRVFIENLLLFLMPTAAYLTWVLITARGSDADDDAGYWRRAYRALDRAPLIWLFTAGAFLTILTITAFSPQTGGKPGQHYEPATSRDGADKPATFD